MASTLLAACSDLTLPGEDLLITSELLPLALSDQAPAPQATTFWVSNSRPTVRRITHSDQFNTPFLEVDFPENSLASLGGAPLGASDSVLITVDPRPGSYGFSLSPDNLTFSSNAEPTVTFFFGLYGDASVATSSTTYSAPADYVAALDIWYEATIGLWRVANSSTTVGPDVVSAHLTLSGNYVLAAPR